MSALRPELPEDALCFHDLCLLPEAGVLLQSGRPVRIGRRAFDLLVVLVRQRHRVVPREELIAAVWPDLVVEDNNLHVQVAALRQVLGPGAITTVARRGYQFSAVVQAPSAAPHSPAQDGQLVPPPAGPNPGAGAPPWQPAVPDLEIRPDALCVVRAGRILPMRPRAMALLLALARRPGQVVAAAELMAQAWPGVRVSENSLQVQVAALRKLLGASLIATVPGQGYVFSPVSAPLLPAVHQDAPALPGAALPVHGLIGRDAELAALASAVASQRLVVVSGPPGIGKSWLARALVQRQASHGAWRDGVVHFDVESVHAAFELPLALAQALGVVLAGRRPALDELADGLRPLQMLLLLDNAHALPAEVAVLAGRILVCAPAVHLLVTSRETTGLETAHPLPLGPLALPEAAPAAGAAAADAVRLFLRQARLARGDAAPGPVDGAPHLAVSLGDVAAACRRLGGRPLAIMLMAGRAARLGPRRRRAWLGWLLRAPGQGSVVDVPALMAWSHRQMPALKHRVFRRLAVFEGGFTAPMAQRVALAHEPEAAAIDTVLQRLVGLGLLAADGQPNPRFHLPGWSRQFARAQLAAAGEAEALALRHAQAMADLLSDGLRGATDDVCAAETLLPEVANAYRAVASAGQQGAHACAITVADGLAALLDRLHRGAEALHLLQGVALQLPPSVPPLALAQLHRRLGMLGADRLLPLAQTQGLLAEAASCFVAHGRPDDGHDCLCLQAQAVLVHGDVDAAEALLRQAAVLEAGRAAGDLRSRRLQMEGRVWLARRQGARALQAFDLAVLAVGAGPPDAGQLALAADRAEALLATRQSAAAAEAFSAVVAATGRSGLTRALLVRALVGQAAAQAALGLAAEARAATWAAASIWRRSGQWLWGGASIAWVAGLQGDLRASAHWLGAVNRHLRGLDAPALHMHHLQALDLLEAHPAESEVMLWMALGAEMDANQLLALLAPVAGPARRAPPAAPRSLRART